MPSLINRRSFLKIAAAAPLVGAGLGWTKLNAGNAAPSNRPNVLVIVFDTLMARHMTVHGYPRDTTPNLQRFANRATVFHRHYAGGSFTSSGTSALLTANYPWTQRSINLMGTVIQEFEHKNLFRVFGDAGYTRVAYTHNWMAAQLLNQFRGDIDYWKPIRDLALSDTEIADRFFANDHDVALSAERVMTVPSEYGTGSLFLSMLQESVATHDEQQLLDKYKAQFPRGLPNSAQTTLFTIEDAVNWLQTELRQIASPSLIYFHLLPPHEPYNPRQEFIGLFEDDPIVEPPKPLHPLGTTFDEIAENLARRHYDEFLAYADAEFGRLYDFMAQEKILDNTYVVFTSDHGQILERGTKGHTNPLLYETITHIPLIISAPGQTQRIDVRTPTSGLDVLPTLAHLIGQPVPNWAEGQVLPTFGGQASPQRSVYTVDAKNSPKQGLLTQATVAMIKDEFKLIHYRGYDKGYTDAFELYNLEQDPEELTDLYSSNRSVAVELQNELLAKLDEVNQPYQRT